MNNKRDAGANRWDPIAYPGAATAYKQAWDSCNEIWKERVKKLLFTLDCCSDPCQSCDCDDIAKNAIKEFHEQETTGNKHNE